MQYAKQRADAAAGRAADYLETKIMHITDPFQMAIVTYALQVAHHKSALTAYNQLIPMGGNHDTSMWILLLTLAVGSSVSTSAEDEISSTTVRGVGCSHVNSIAQKVVDGVLWNIANMQARVYEPTT